MKEWELEGGDGDESVRVQDYFFSLQRWKKDSNRNPCINQMRNGAKFVARQQKEMTDIFIKNDKTLTNNILSCGLTTLCDKVRGSGSTVPTEASADT